MVGLETPEHRMAARGMREEHYAPATNQDRETVIDAPAPALVPASGFAGMATPTRKFLDEARLFPMRNVTMLAGDGGTGKSLLAMQLGIAVAGGGQWIGITVRHGKAIYISAEDDIDECHIRLKDICSAASIDVASLDGLLICDLANRDASFCQEGSKPGTVVFTRLFDHVSDLARNLRPELIVLDNLADIYSANENVRSEARQFVSRLRALAMETGCAILLLAHPSLSGLNSGSGTSGSTAWSNSVRSRLYLTRPRTDLPDPDIRLLETMKANYGKVGGTIELRWQDGYLVRSRFDTGDRESRAAAAEAQFLNLLLWHCQMAINVSPHASNTFAPKVFAEHDQAGGFTKAEFRRAMERLLDTGKIRTERVGPKSRQRTILALP